MNDTVPTLNIEHDEYNDAWLHNGLIYVGFYEADGIWRTLQDEIQQIEVKVFIC